jgi:hypothetical protein
MGAARCVAGTPAGGDGPLDADAGQSRPESHAPGLGVFPPRLACTMAAFHGLVHWHGVGANASGFMPLSLAELSVYDAHTIDAYGSPRLADGLGHGQQRASAGERPPEKPQRVPASTALPQPPKPSTKVPTASASYHCIACSPHCHAPCHRGWPTRHASASCLWARARLPRHVCPRRRATGHRLGRASLFAATERGFDFFEGREIFLEPINMLLHLDDG